MELKKHYELKEVTKIYKEFINNKIDIDVMVDILYRRSNFYENLNFKYDIISRRIDRFLPKHRNVILKWSLQIIKNGEVEGVKPVFTCEILSKEDKNQIRDAVIGKIGFNKPSLGIVAPQLMAEYVVEKINNGFSEDKINNVYFYVSKIDNISLSCFVDWNELYKKYQKIVNYNFPRDYFDEVIMKIINIFKKYVKLSERDNCFIKKSPFFASAKLTTFKFNGVSGCDFLRFANYYGVDLGDAVDGFICGITEDLICLPTEIKDQLNSYQLSEKLRGSK